MKISIGFVNIPEKERLLTRLSLTVGEPVEPVLDKKILSPIVSLERGIILKAKRAKDSIIPDLGGGNWSPGKVVLLVGDRFNDSMHYSVPFVRFTHHGCSLWLAYILNQSGIKEENLFWVNAYHLNGEPICSDFIRELNPLGIVALGDNASVWCRKNNLFHTKVPHPSYFKRFKHNEQYDLPTVISKLLGGS